MPKIPNLIKASCKTCKYSLFKLALVKKKPPSSLSAGQRRKKAMGKRGNLGRYSKPPVRSVKKSKWPHILLECTTCGLKRNISRPRCVKLQVIKKNVNR